MFIESCFVCIFASESENVENYEFSEEKNRLISRKKNNQCLRDYFRL